MQDFWKLLVRFFTSLRLTVVLLALSILLIFIATLDQTNLGIYAIQQKYFRSLFALVTIPGTRLITPLPGGYLIGGLLLINLIASHFYRFKFSLKKSGIWLTHLGLILLLVGELVSGVLQEDFQMRIGEGETKNYSESFHFNELAIIDTSDPQHDTVVAIPEEWLTRTEPVQNHALPFRVEVKTYFPNAIVAMRDQVPTAPQSPATTGMGTRLAVFPQPVTYRPDENNTPAAVVELIGAQGSLGTYLLSTQLPRSDSFTYEGKTWKIALRTQRRYEPFSLTLLKVTHDIYPGSDIPKNFSSQVRLKTDDGREDREVRVFMNNPLRHGGLTFYQYQMSAPEKFTVFQVVSNPGRLLPYIACPMMALGLVIQFLISLVGFIDKRTASPAAS